MNRLLSLRVSVNPSQPPTDRETIDQWQQDIENKLKHCLNPTYECTIPRIEGYEYCIRHILRDARSSYRQCSYLYTNGKKCQNAVFKHDIKKDPAMTTFCFEHSRHTQILKTHATVGKYRRTETNEALLNNLTHHLDIEEQAVERAIACEQDEEIDVVSAQVTPFVYHEQINNLTNINTTIKKRRRILDYASESSEEDEPVTISNTARGQEANESDDESTGSSNDDCLKHAGVYTRQEVLRITESKLTKLQGLYIDQINRLHHVLKERRRRYLHEIRREREHLSSIHDQTHGTPRERALYGQLKAMNSYHRRHGTEAVLHKKYKDKRSRVNDTTSHKGPGVTKCIYTEGGVKCGERVLPSSKYCRKHILEDKKQILFRACEVEKSGIVCQEPIPCVFDDATCVLHLMRPNKRQYVQRKYESETEEEQDNDMKHELMLKQIKVE